MKQLVVSALLLIAPLLVYASTDATDVISIPEPATLALLGIGGAAALVARWRKRK